MAVKTLWQKVYGTSGDLQRGPFGKGQKLFREFYPSGLSPHHTGAADRPFTGSGRGLLTGASPLSERPTGPIIRKAGRSLAQGLGTSSSST